MPICNCSAAQGCVARAHLVHVRRRIILFCPTGRAWADHNKARSFPTPTASLGSLCRSMTGSNAQRIKTRLSFSELARLEQEERFEVKFEIKKKRLQHSRLRSLAPATNMLAARPLGEWNRRAVSSLAAHGPLSLDPASDELDRYHLKTHCSIATIPELQTIHALAEFEYPTLAWVDDIAIPFAAACKCNSVRPGGGRESKGNFG